MSEEVLFDAEEQPHLLLVDDDETFTRVLARAMTRRGLRVSVANSADEGLALAERDPYGPLVGFSAMVMHLAWSAGFWMQLALSWKRGAPAR